MTAGDRRQLESAIDGNVLTPGDDGYDAARALWNIRFDRRPDLIARCRRTEDVQSAVRFARERALELSIKGGGHAFAANTVGDGGLLIDLSSLNDTEVDPEARTARVGAGAKWRDVDPVTQRHALATPGGTLSGVGVAGFTLGGGMGYLSRKHGLAIDNLQAVEVVTADGSLVRASSEEHPDLFWALRGGGGNFGIATAFEFRLHEVGPQVLSGQVFHRFEDTPRVLRCFREFMSDAPDEVQCYPFFLRVPPLEMFPAEYHGQLVLDLVMFHADPDGKSDLAPLAEAGEPFLSFVQPQPYVEVQQAFDQGMPAGHRYDSRAHDLPCVDDEVIETLMAQLPHMPGELTIAYLAPGGGAIARVGPTATAFPHRKAPFSVHVMAGWFDAYDDDRVEQWLHGFSDAVKPHATGGVYVNVLGVGEEDRVRAAYGANFDRLADIKRIWDPDNAFTRNHNIPPHRAAPAGAR